MAVVKGADGEKTSGLEQLLQVFERSACREGAI